MADDQWAYAPGASLPGGYIKAVVRIDDTVHRPVDSNAEFVQSLLVYLEASGFEGAPRFLGMDDEGREVLSFVEGHVAWDADQPESVSSDESLAEVARLTRRLHDLTAGSALAGDAPTICHNDLSPKNTVYRDLGEGYRPVAFIDWDGAAPGEPEEDLARMLWQFLLTSERRNDANELARGMALMLDAYGLAAEPATLLDRIVQNMQDTMRVSRSEPLPAARPTSGSSAWAPPPPFGTNWSGSWSAGHWSRKRSLHSADTSSMAFIPAPRWAPGCR